MNVIFVGRKSGRVKQFDLRHPVIMSAAALFVLAILGTAFSIGVGLGARHGGHNPLEPAALSKVPVYGPSMENFSEMSGKFLAAGAAIQVKNSEQLGAAWRSLLREPERAARMGASARELVDRNRGATQRVLDRIERFVDSNRGGT